MSASAKKVLFYLFFILFAGAAPAQDYLVTWKNDTIPCRFPKKPWKEGLRPAYKYANGHIRLAAFFEPDSVRILEAGQIRAYYRKEHGGDLLCNGDFESLKALGWRGTTGREKQKDGSSWYFMNRVLQGEYASLYMVYVHTSRQPMAVYFLKKEGSHAAEAEYFFPRKKQQALLADPDIATEINALFSNNEWKKVHDLVRRYNQLKAAAAAKKQSPD